MPDAPTDPVAVSHSLATTAVPLVTDPAEIARRYRYWRVRVMYSMTAGYALFYFVRKNMSMATKAITDEFHYTNTQWGTVLGIATIVYAWSKFLSGVIGDRANPRYLLAFGLMLSAIVNLAFGFGASLGFFVVFWALNNLFQGAGVPPCVRLLTSWFSPREIGRAWGVWNASHQIGGALIFLWSGWLITHFGWRAAFWAPGALCVLGSFWLLNRLTNSPEAQGLPPVEVFHGDTGFKNTTVESDSFWAIFKAHIVSNPWVWLVSAANFFVYVVRIGIFDWAPKYLQEAKGFTLGDAGWAGFWFELAGIFGAFASGWLTDKYLGGRRGPIAATFMLGLVLGLLCLFLVPAKSVVTMCCLFAALGFLVYGPQMLVAVAAADFATKVASSSAVGLTGLFGYVGASFCAIMTGRLVDLIGWNAAIWFYASSALIGFLLLLPTWSRVAPTIANSGTK